MFGIIGFLDFLEKNHSCGEVLLNSDFYLDPKLKGNWWEYHFEPIKILPANADSELKITPYPISNNWYNYAITEMPFSRIRELFDRYIKPKPHVLHKVRAFCEQNFGDKTVVGLHYRGTDKQRLESDFIGYNAVFEQVTGILQQLESSGQVYVLFVATDEQEFLDAICERFPGTVYQTGLYRPYGKRPIHFSMPDPYHDTEAAIIDFILLSRANILIRTSSLLSFMASIVSPNLKKQVMLNKSNWLFRENV